MCNIEDIVVDSGLFGKIWDMPFIDISKYIDKHSWVYAVLSYNTVHDLVLISLMVLINQREKWTEP